MLLVALSLPRLSPEVMRAMASITELAPADLRMRLGGAPPRIIVTDADAERLRGMAERLRGLGVTPLVCDPACAPTDHDRVVARRLEFGRTELTVFDGRDVAHVCPWRAIAFIQRGARETVEKHVVKSVVKKFDAGKAIITGGLLLSSKHEVTSTTKRESSERFLLLHRSDGEPDVMVYERHLDYRFLGADMQGASYANIEATTRRLVTAAPRAPVDDRVSRPGFVRGLPATTVDALDLGLYLIELTLRMGVQGEGDAPA